MGSPPKSTFLTAIHTHPALFGTFPGLTYDLINKHILLSTTTPKGYMVQNKKGLCSTISDRKQVMNARKHVSNMSPVEQIC
jgi:hypothetical protein